eukprot:m.481997 g.481997  ORF g.481997 m.481997 type:complete len:165 (-) comp22400_c0_seq1:1804-2298(-)
MAGVGGEPIPTWRRVCSCLATHTAHHSLLLGFSVTGNPKACPFVRFSKRHTVVVLLYSARVLLLRKFGRCVCACVSVTTNEQVLGGQTAPPHEELSKLGKPSNQPTHAHKHNQHDTSPLSLLEGFVIGLLVCSSQPASSLWWPTFICSRLHGAAAAVRGRLTSS